ncbi:pickpocket protein 28-like isoform X2 [Nilaparvata lugens]|uniref:pickpocket protein 28-like isoform X2 n=1 Tax=Nilaparvata lugens TaxID=108931 RepID=UPI00193CEA4D|nr:pickpocket protein 28-like isoform X2 [Nilaparvata lugens]
MDTRRNRNWTNAQAAYQINSNYLDQYPSVRFQNAKNVRPINVKQYKGDENKQPNFNKKRAGEQDEKVVKKKKKEYSIFKQFCQETSFHGFNYLGEENRSNLERAFWIIVLAFFYYESVQLLIHGYRMFSTRTVIINIDGSPPLVSDIPFPALTICSSNQITKSGLERVQNDEQLREHKDDIISHLCQVYRNHETSNENASKRMDSRVITNFLQKVGSLNCTKTIIEQLWLSSLQEDNCHNMQQIVTFFGVCHTFNMLPLDQLYTESFYHNHYKHQMNNITSGVPGLGVSWTPETGYKKSANFKSMEVEIPYRTTGVSLVHSLIIFADIQENDFTPVCNQGTKGFFIIAHNPAELPGLPHQTSFIPSDRTSILKVKTTTHKLDKRLVSWKPKERQCYLERERSLKFFRYYTEQNCRLECQTNFTLLLCGCVPFYLPHFTSTSICGPAKESCFKTLWWPRVPPRSRCFIKIRLLQATEDFFSLTGMMELLSWAE